MALISRLLGERVAAVILAIVALNAVMAFVQEYRAERALEALQSFVTRTARVRRDGAIVDIPAGSLVRGDAVLLELGDLVPADLALEVVDGLSTDKASLTGESVPVTKSPGETAYLGSTVLSGNSTGVVSATGSATLVVFGLLSVIFDLSLIAGLLAVWRVDTAVFRSAWFVESACSEMLVTFAIRTRLPFWRSRPGGALLWSSVAGAAVAFALPFTPLGRDLFAFMPIPTVIGGFIFAILLGYFLAAEALKRAFFARSGGI